MGKFIAGFCCIVVGLQVLIGVPLAVCGVFYLLMEGGSGPVGFDASFSGPYPSPSTIAPPSYSGPLPVIAPLPAAPAPLQDVADGPAEAAIVEARERIGSPLAGTVFAPQADEKSDERTMVQSLRQIAAEPPVIGLPSVKEIAEPPAAAPTEQSALTACHPDPLAHLRAAVQQLYALATRYEVESSFGRADQVRQLARDLRGEIDRQPREESLLRGPVVGGPAGPPAAVEAIKPAFAPSAN